MLHVTVWALPRSTLLRAGYGYRYHPFSSPHTYIKLHSFMNVNTTYSPLSPHAITLHDIQAVICTLVAQFYRTSYHPTFSLTLLPSHHFYRNMATKSLSAASPASIPPLLRLPAELHLDIVSELEESDPEGAVATLNLRLSNRYFYNLVDKPSHDTLLYVEKTSWAVSRSLYTCKFCVRLRPASTFAETMLKGKTGPNGLWAKKRFCADCGFAAVQRETRYSAGTMVTVNGERWIWCVYCREVKKGNQAGKKEWCEKGCKRCFERVGFQCFGSCKSAAKQSGSDTVGTHETDWQWYWDLSSSLVRPSSDSEFGWRSDMSSLF
jgi:hypothetical protein